MDVLCMDLCNDVDFLRTIYLIKNLLIIVKIGVPLILIIMCSLDIYKVVVRKIDFPSRVFFNRFVAGVLVFLIPTMLNVVLSTLGENKVGETVCWVNANEEAINVLQSQLNQEREAREAAEKARKEALAKEREENRRLREERIQASLQVPSTGGSSLGGSGSYELSSEFSENGTDGQVTVEYGIFYKPSTYTSGTDGTKGSAPYGYNKYFYARLQNFISAAAEQGYTLTISTSTYGAWRPYSLQQYYWNCYQTKSCNNGNLAAVPGSSNHGWGIASDLAFGSVAAMYWAHDNAKNFGLSFNLCDDIRGSCQENWHIEPIYIIKR